MIYAGACLKKEKPGIEAIEIKLVQYCDATILP